MEELNVYQTTFNFKELNIFISKFYNNECNRIFFEREEDNLFFSYSTINKEIIVYEDSNYKKVSSVIKMKDFYNVCDVLNCLCFDEKEDPEVEVVNEDKTENSEEIEAIENEENYALVDRRDLDGKN